jgi:hypothetical protein
MTVVHPFACTHADRTATPSAQPFKTIPFRPATEMTTRLVGRTTVLRRSPSYPSQQAGEAAAKPSPGDSKMRLHRGTPGRSESCRC